MFEKLSGINYLDVMWLILKPKNCKYWMVTIVNCETFFPEILIDKIANTTTGLMLFDGGKEYSAHLR